MVALTERQREVLDGVRRGLNSQEIAVELQIAKRTVDEHIGKMYAKFHARNRVQLINAVDAQGREAS